MTEERKAPAIRFKEFSGQNAEAWEQRKLEECSEISAGGDIDKSKLLNNGKYPVVANALTNDGIIGYYNDSFRIEAPAVTVTGRGNVGVAKARNENFTPVVRLLSLKSDYDVVFLENAINTQNIVIESTGVPQLTVPQLGNYKIFFPSPPEQKVIGSFFQDLDKLITLQQRKLEKSRRIKKAMLQKMFPENKQTVPAIRFKEFSGQNAEAWEQRKLEECTEISAGGDIDKSKLLNKGKYPVIANALTNDGIIGYYNDSYRIEAPAVTVTGRGNVGVAKARNVSFTPVVRLLSLKSEYDVIFLENAINIQNIVIESTGVPQLTVPQLGSYKIFFPTPPEQRDIGSFFQDLDKFIALQQRRLDKLQNMKKALLEQMMM